MPKERLGLRYLKLQVPEDKDVVHWDTELPGFGAKVTPTGRIVFFVQYRPKGQGGNPRKLTIGTFGEFTPEQARDAAREVITAKARGEDPQAEKRASRQRRSSNQFSDVLDRFIAQHVSQTRSAGETERILRKEFGTIWRNCSVLDIKKRDVVEVLDGIAERGSKVMANRSLAAIRKLFNWCVSRDILEHSPCAGIAAPTRERTRDRTLSDDELRTVVLAARRFGYPFGLLVEMLALTGQRRDEVAEMEWTHVDLDRRMWTIPGVKAKNGKAHIVHLSDQARDVLQSVPKVGSLIFSTDGNTTYRNWGRAKQRLDELMVNLRSTALEGRGAEPTPWRLHDLRRTMVTGMANLNVPHHVADKILNHQSGAISGVAAVYQRHEFLEERKRALELWGRHVASLLAEQDSNVVRLSRAH
jgi:integrase